MSSPLRRQHFFAVAFLLFLASECRTSPLPKLRDGDRAEMIGVKSGVIPKVVIGAKPISHVDQAHAASDHGHFGRVQIKVYRGPDDHHHHAPYGYWVKHPADDAPHHH